MGAGMSAPLSRQERRQLAILKLLKAGTAAHLQWNEGDPARLLTANGTALMTVPAEVCAAMLAADHITLSGPAHYQATSAGLAWLLRTEIPELAFRAQHGAVKKVCVEDPQLLTRSVWRDEAESPLAWLRARRGKDGKPLLDEAQFAAGERLREDATRAQLMARTTANWQASVANGRRQSGATDFADATLAARERVNSALAAVGAELSGILLDVCCYLKSMEQIERERGWPARSGRIVLGLALTRLADHYGLRAQARGPARGTMQSWRAPSSVAPGSDT